MSSFTVETMAIRHRLRYGAMILIIAIFAMSLTSGEMSDAQADPQEHQVTYTVTTTSDLMANIQYIYTDPPTIQAYNAHPDQYLKTEHVPISAGVPLTYTVQLRHPEQWALVNASGGLRVNPEFHCEISVDDTVLISQDGGSGVRCAGQSW